MKEIATNLGETKEHWWIMDNESGVILTFYGISKALSWENFPGELPVIWW